MSMEAAEFRRILGHMPTGVTVVAATEPDGAPRGLTASAVASTSLDPPLVLVCVERTSDTHACIGRAGAFAVSVLDEGAEGLARRFATFPAEEKFEGVAYRRERTGSPVLESALAWVDCRVWARYDGGDHTIYVGEVVAGDAQEGSPLLYYRGGYARLTP